MSYFRQKREIFLPIFICLIFFSKGFSDDINRTPINEALLQKSLIQVDSLRLWEHPRWKRLLHLNSSSGQCSDLDGGYFFLDPQGKCDAKKELIQTLKAFYDPNYQFINRDSLFANEYRIHPLAKFKARHKFLVEQKIIDPKPLFEIDDSEYNLWYQKLEPKGLKIIYATGYLGNPASIMGHTFLLLNSYKNDSTRESLNYAITFSANPGSDRGFTYALKGIFGAFKGSYDLSQYHLQMQNYLYQESRDLWEYDLNLEADELDYFIKHLWELGSSYSDYYFFSENCSYGLLSILEAASLNFNFREAKSGIVLPLETLKSVKNDYSVLSNEKYRPSLKRQFEIHANHLQSNQKENFYRLINPNKALEFIQSKLKEEVNLNDTLLIKNLDVVLDYYQFLKRTSTDSTQIKLWSKIQRNALFLRSKLPAKISQNISHVPPTESPYFAPAPHQFTYGIGLESAKIIHQFKFRLMYQSYSDYNAGLARGLNLEAIGLDMAFRSDNRINHDNANEGEFYLNEFLIARIANLNPYNRYFKPLSWRIALTIDRFSDENRFRIEPLKYHLDLGLGLSFGSIEPRSTLIFWSADIDQTLEVGDLQYDFLPGTSLIIRKEFSKNFILFSKIKSYFSLLENKTLILTQDIELSWTPSPWLELELGYKQYLLDLSESSLTLNFKANF